MSAEEEPRAGDDQGGAPAVPQSGFRRPTLLPRRRVSIYDRLELLAVLAVLLTAALTPPRDAQGQPNAPLRGTLLATSGGGLCLYRRATGVDCGGCGLTRAFVQLAHGSPRAAVELNPLSPLVFVWVVLHALKLWVLNVTGRAIDDGIPPRWRWRGYGLVFAAFALLWALRLVAHFAAPAA